MPHQTELVVTVAAGLGMAFLFGFLAARLRLPPLVGYLLAGVALSPFTPGPVGDTAIAGQLAEIGVILLMFGVGLHFSFADLLAVRRVAVPGAAAQIAVATGLGVAAARLWGWSWGAGLVFGLSLSVASTVVLLRALEERGLLDSDKGRIAIGWLIVEDLATVIVLVLLPALSPSFGGTAPAQGGPVLVTIAVTLGKVAVFVAIMHIVGRRAVPWLLERVVRIGSRELFTLAVLAIALGIAVGAASLFGVSFALGAFFAGVVISESDLSQRAASDALPLQDAFAVLFFVSVGMLFDPSILLHQPLRLLLVLLIVLVGKSAAAFVIVRVFGKPVSTALTISASLAQVGEFSFILAALGVSLGILPVDAQSLILAAALLSITLNPLVFNTIGAVARRLGEAPGTEPAQAAAVEAVASGAAGRRSGHAVLVGHGRVGGRIGEALLAAGVPQVVIEEDHAAVEALRRRGVDAIYGNAARPGILEHAALPAASLLVVAAPDPFQARRIIEIARELNPKIEIVVRTHSAAERAHLEGLGVGRVFMGEHELALAMARHALRTLGVDDAHSERTLEELRRG